jgi:hypothetical protein
VKGGTKEVICEDAVDDIEEAKEFQAVVLKLVDAKHLG